jgi:hypothetical protein
MSGCKTDAQVGDEITYRSLVDAQLLKMTVESIQTGTAQGCLYVGHAGSVWDWQVTEVNGEPVTT